MHRAVKYAAGWLNYPVIRIPLNLVNTYSLRSVGACALSLSGHKPYKIMKMGRWAPNSLSFMEYIQEKSQRSLQECLHPWARLHPSQTWKLLSWLNTCEQIQFTKRWHWPRWEEPPKNEPPYLRDVYVYRVDICSFAFSIPNKPEISYCLWCLSVQNIWQKRVCNQATTMTQIRRRVVWLATFGCYVGFF